MLNFEKKDFKAEYADFFHCFESDWQSLSIKNDTLKCRLLRRRPGKASIRINQAENRGVVVQERNLWDQVLLVNSRVLILKIDVKRGFWGAISLFFVSEVSFWGYEGNQ